RMQPSRPRPLEEQFRPFPGRGRPALTLISCLVQPWSCNPGIKKRCRPNGAGQQVPRVTTKKEEKSSTGTVCLLTPEAIWLFGPRSPTVSLLAEAHHHARAQGDQPCGVEQRTQPPVPFSEHPRDRQR